MHQIEVVFWETIKCTNSFLTIQAEWSTSLQIFLHFNMILFYLVGFSIFCHALRMGSGNNEWAGIAQSLKTLARSWRDEIPGGKRNLSLHQHIQTESWVHLAPYPTYQGLSAHSKTADMWSWFTHHCLQPTLRVQETLPLPLMYFPGRILRCRQNLPFSHRGYKGLII
jgi:hypothetical protein